MQLKKKLYIAGIVLAVVIAISIIALLIISNLKFGFVRNVSSEEKQLRERFVTTAEAWLGYNKADGSHRQIVDLYNEHEPLAQNYTVSYDDKWCATFVSAASIKCGFTDIIPTECGCERQIELFQSLECWEEDDAYVPLPGDIIYYSASDSGRGDCTAWSDHVGIVVGVYGPYIKVIEGNVLDRVAYRYVRIDGNTIRGYAIPDYSSIAEKLPTD